MEGIGSAAERVASVISFDGRGLVPAIAQDSVSGEVLMMAWMDGEALRETLRTGMATYYSRSRGRLWVKGDESGNTPAVDSVHCDCDADALLIKVRQKGSACHTGNRTCFYRGVSLAGEDAAPVGESGDPLSGFGGPMAGPGPEPGGGADIGVTLGMLMGTVEGRKAEPKAGSYTSYLLGAGMDKILKKVGEESAEVIIAAKNKASGEVAYEVSDLIYHLSVMLCEMGMDWGAIGRELRGRMGKG